MKLTWLIPIGIATIAGYPRQTDITNVIEHSPKIKNDVRFVILSDLHGAYYGKDNQDLIEMVRTANPDGLLLPGDIFDEWCDVEKTFHLLEQLKDIPMFYCTGNHEEHREDIYELLERLRQLGIHVLHKETETLTIKDTTIEIGGIRCYLSQLNYDAKELNPMFHTEYYRILLSHRPHWVDLYKEMDCDLVISGHAHGGQWRLPNGHRGLIAPQQGFFPKYTEGVLSLGKVKLVISRGLVRDYHGIPRLFNNPEIIVLDLKPE